MISHSLLLQRIRGTRRRPNESLIVKRHRPNSPWHPYWNHRPLRPHKAMSGIRRPAPTRGWMLEAPVASSSPTPGNTLGAPPKKKHRNMTTKPTTKSTRWCPPANYQGWCGIAATHPFFTPTLGLDHSLHPWDRSVVYPRGRSDNFPRRLICPKSVMEGCSVGNEVGVEM